MKKIIVLPLVILLFSGISLSAQIQREGLIEATLTLDPTNDSKPLAERIRKNKVWFKDSFLIYEYRIEYSTEEQTKEGTIKKRSYPVSTYEFVDLRSMHCQNYAHFSDTATPLSHYILNHDIRWDFSSNPIKDSLDIVFLPDTVIDQTIVKRVQLTYRRLKPDKYHYVFYLYPDMHNNIFHYDKAIDLLIPGYKAHRWEIVQTDPTYITDRNEFKINRDQLTAEEEKIFNQWKINAANTDLPLISSMEAFKTFASDNLKHDPDAIIKIEKN